MTAALDILYDLESYPNFACVTFKAAGPGGAYWYFEISDRRNDIGPLCDFVATIRQWGARLVGFNNIGFDYPVLHSILMRPDQATAANIYTTVCHIINKPHEDRFGHIIWDRDQIIPQLDLYKIHHFDNKAKYTSLKILQFNMRSAAVQELPFAPGSWLTWQQMDVVVAYNRHDVDETEAFYWYSIDLIRFREELSSKYNRNFINHNDTKIGKDYFIMRLEEAAPGACYDSSSGSRRPRQTVRQQIALADVVFPYIQFQQPEFNRILQWFKGQVIEDASIIKGIFTDISCIVEGFQFDFGAGGLHGSVSSQTVSSDAEWVLLDLDAKSYYPNLAIANSLYPLHLGQIFPAIYKDVYELRSQYGKHTPENAMLKLALNGVYGDSNNPYSVFFDTQYTMSITVNGQLLLCMLAEQLMRIPDLQMIQANTDGLTVRIPRTVHEHVTAVCKWWEGFTHLELEEAIYDHMHIRDCNAYIGRYSNGKIKRKGPYRSVFNPPNINKGLGDLEWHQDHSALVIPMAVESALINGESVADFIHNHDNLFDFMLRTKIPRSSRLVLHTEQGDAPLQNVCRYYVSKTGGSLVKIMPPLARKPDAERRIGICVGWRVSEANDITQAVGSDIDFDYYIQEAEKLLKPLQEVVR